MESARTTDDPDESGEVARSDTTDVIPRSVRSSLSGRSQKQRRWEVRVLPVSLLNARGEEWSEAVPTGRRSAGVWNKKDPGHPRYGSGLE
jgi:hypothetical protein